MIRDKRRLQLYTSAALSFLILCLGILWSWYAIGLLRETAERQMAEDNEIIGANLRIIIRQVTQKYADQEMALSEIQNVLEALKEKKWFACVLDQKGFVLAAPQREMVNSQAPLKTYKPTALLGTQAPPLDALSEASETGRTGVYKTESDIIAIQWLPNLMTYLCVHQSQQPMNEKIGQLRRVLIQITIGFMFLVGMGSWFFVGWLVDRYESHLSLSEYRNRTLVQNSAPILVGAPSGQILHVNPEARTLFGIPPDQTDLNLRDLWLTDHADRLDEILHIGVNQSLEMNDLDMVNLDGRQIPIDLRACAIDYENKVAVYFLFRDITESRRAQEEILEANRKLQELDQLKTDFINNVSHELRTPISTIQFAEASLKNILKDTPDKNIPKLLGFIRDDGKRLRDLIEQLLQFSRLDAGQLKLNIQHTDLSHLLAQVQTEVALLVQAKNQTLAVSPARSSFALEGDSEQLHRVLVNVVNNAIKYTPKDGKIQIDLSQTNGQFTIQVSDTGIGIPSKDLSHIFDKFYRTNQDAVLNEPGTGLGLTIVKGIVEAHGGQILVESEEGSGTTFVIHLPQKQAT